MIEVRVHNYAFRKALAYVRNKRGKKVYESCISAFENTVHTRLSTRSPYLPSYYPIKSFVIFLQIINSTMGEDKIQSLKKVNRYHDIGFYLYTGSEVQDSPYHYLDPHKSLFEVVSDFYNNLKTASGIFRDCGTELVKKDSKIETHWDGLGEYVELFHYLEGVHSGMIKESSSEGELTSKKKKNTFIFEIKILN